MPTIESILKSRFGVSSQESQVIIQNAKNEISNGADPYMIVVEYFNLKPEYVFDLV